MKKGISFEIRHNEWGNEILHLEKKRGKFTLDEIKDILRYSDGASLNGYWAIKLYCTENNGFDGWLGEDDPGNVVDLYRLYESEDCPICGEMLPPFEYCPHCGKPWQGGDKE